MAEETSKKKKRKPEKTMIKDAKRLKPGTSKLESENEPLDQQPSKKKKRTKGQKERSSTGTEMESEGQEAKTPSRKTKKKKRAKGQKRRKSSTEKESDQGKEIDQEESREVGLKSGTEDEEESREVGLKSCTEDEEVDQEASTDLVEERTRKNKKKKRAKGQKKRKSSTEKESEEGKKIDQEESGEVGLKSGTEDEEESREVGLKPCTEDEEVDQEASSGKSTRKKGGKHFRRIVRYKDSEKYQEDLKKQEKSEMTEAKRRSRKDEKKRKQHQKFRAAFDSDDTGTPSPSTSEDEDSPQSPSFVAVSVGESGEKENSGDEREGSHESDEGDGENDDEDEAELGTSQPGASAEAAPPKPKRQRRGTKFLEPDSDNDPGEADENDLKEDEDDGWTRNLTKQKTKSHRPSGKAGLKFSNLKQPLDFFLLFFPLRLFALMVNWTNHQLRKAKMPITNLRELKAWFGIHLVMGLVKISNSRDYWSDHPGYRNELIARTMPRARFDTISSHLQCCAPEDNLDEKPQTTPEEKKDVRYRMKSTPCWPIQPLWNAVVKKCRENYIPLRNLSIDEAMVRYKGFKSSAHKFFMPLKPAKAGFKIYAMAEAATGYISNFTSHMTTPAKSVLDVTLELAEPVLHRFHHIFTDKYYTSIPLAEQLLRNDTYLTGAINQARRGLPNSLKKSKSKVKRLQRARRGTCYSRQNGKLVYTLWKDSRVASILTTFHDGFRNRDTDYVYRRYSWDGIRPRQRQAVRAPPAIISYTKNMGGVDRADQLRAYNTSARKSQIWWRQLLFFLIDLCRVNAWICYKVSKRITQRHAPVDMTDDEDEEPATCSYESPTPRHSRFIMDLACELIDGYEGQHSTTQSRGLGPVRAENVQHRLVRTDAPLTCRMCSLDKKKTPKGGRVKSRSKCAACNIYFCKNNDCFIRYHSAHGLEIPADNSASE